MLRDSGFSTFKPVVTPLPLNLKLRKANSPPLPNPQLYPTLVGKLNFLIHTRPDLAYTIQTLSQYMQAPTEAHFEALQHTLNYV